MYNYDLLQIANDAKWNEMLKEIQEHAAGPDAPKIPDPSTAQKRSKFCDKGIYP